MHLVIARVPTDRLGAVKLNKILWFSDCQYYARHGRTITGEDAYIRKDNGPCVARFESTLSGLKEDGAIVEKRVPALDYVRREFFAQTEPDLSILSGEEVDMLLVVAAQIAPMTAAEASALSHDDLWDATPHRGAIPVAAAAVRWRRNLRTTSTP